jgi:hypothetical protein
MPDSQVLETGISKVGAVAAQSSDESEDIVVIGLESPGDKKADGASSDSGTVDGKGQDPALSFDERYQRLRRYVYSNPRHREINYKILKYCREPRLLGDLEGHISSCPEFKAAAQSQYFLFKWIEEHGGLTEYELDGTGEVIELQRKQGLTEDEVDDLVVDFSYQSTDVGLRVATEMDPKHRLIELLSIVPEHYDTYIEVLEFLKERQGFAKVDSMLRGRDVLFAGRKPGDQPMQPSLFVDRLERAGGICWDEGWMITTEGKELLDTIKERAKD